MLRARVCLTLAAVVGCATRTVEPPPRLQPPAALAVPAQVPASPPAAAPSVARAEPSEALRVEPFELRSALLSEFAGTDVEIEAMVMTPPNFDPDHGYAVHYVVHGFGGGRKSSAVRYAMKLQSRVDAGTAPPMLRVFLDANHRLGHHVFADSANTGPWGTALVQEFLPAIEARYGAIADPRARFVSGHSSGGWASLWLQVRYPEAFGGVWSTAPDPVDFRDFTGIDLYAFDDMYRDPKGNPVQLVHKGGKPVLSFEDYTRSEIQRQPIGGQIYSFDAVFSPRNDDGQPRPVFDRDTGRIDHDVVEAWKAYDIRLRLREQWPTLAPKLAGKLHIVVGSQDTFGLHRAVILLKAELEALGSDAEVVVVEGRDHSDLFEPHPQLYPEGLLTRIEDEMWASFAASGLRDRAPE